MDMDQPHEEVHKKGRQRKKQLYNTIRKQIEFYFSDSNLLKDRFMKQLIEENEYIDLSVFMKCNKVRKLTSTTDDIVKALQKSEFLEFSEDKTKLRRTTPISEKTNSDDCTLYVQQIKSDTTHEWLEHIFSDFGKVVYISLPKYKKNNLNKGFAFVEYDTEDEAKAALEFFEKIGSKITAPPEELCSITSYQEEGGHENMNGVCEEVQSEVDKKRKLSEDAVENEDNKRVKLDEGENGDNKGKKKKTSKKKFKELGFEVLSKKEWKVMRNRYLNMQRMKMKELKGHLKKKLCNNKFEDKRKQAQKENNAETIDKTGKEKLPFIPGVIVKIQLSESYTDPKKLKNEIKNAHPDCLYVDTPVTMNSDEVYLRFSKSESAQKYCEKCDKGSAVLLAGKEENEYWEHIQSKRDIKLKKENKKVRGREKLLKKAERELGKHIRFDAVID